MQKRNTVVGILLITAGIIVILARIIGIDIGLHNFWPLLILGIGLIFEYFYFVSSKNPGLLVPGGIFTTIGLLFIFETITGWGFAAYTWPIYPLAVAVGLFQLYLFSGRPRPLLIPIFILSGITVIAYLTMILSVVFSWISFGIIFPLLLILIGFFLLIRR